MIAIMSPSTRNFCFSVVFAPLSTRSEYFIAQSPCKSECNTFAFHFITERILASESHELLQHGIVLFMVQSY